MYSLCFDPYPGVKVDRNFLGTYAISRYYSVMPDQKRYYYGRTYEEDLAMNCGSTCLETANGYHLTDKDEFRIVACPPNLKLGTKLKIEGLGTVTCQDRGGSIKGQRLDLWTGIGDRGLSNIMDRKGYGKRKVFLIP